MNAGEAAQTQCLAVKGDTPLNITWTFHGDVTTFQTGVVTASVGQRGSALIIDSVTTNHAGIYTCTVRNQVASASYSTVLSVSGLFTAQIFRSICHLEPTDLIPVSRGRSCVYEIVKFSS